MLSRTVSLPVTTAKGFAYHNIFCSGVICYFVRKLNLIKKKPGLVEFWVVIVA